MVGSLLMLVAILATAFIARDITGQFTFAIRDLAGVQFTDTQSTWLFAGLRPGLRHQAAAVALPRLAARRLPHGADPGDRCCWRR